MFSNNRAVLALQIMSIITILVGLVGLLFGIVTQAMIVLGTARIPVWILGGAMTYMGIRYWRRIPGLEKKMQTSNE
jgi:hypothetical protein